MSISLAIIVKNSEATLENTLKSFEPVVDEIIVVDTGSSDLTKDISYKYTKNVFDYKWENDFSKAKNYAISLCKNEWILNPDSDEYIDSENYELIKELSKDLTLGGVTFLQHSERENKNPLLVSCLRYFRNLEKIKFKYSIHEVIAPKIILDLELKIVRTDIKLHHSGFSYDNLIKQKHKRNLNILKTKLFLSNIDTNEYFHYGTYYIRSTLNTTTQNSQEKNVGLKLINVRNNFINDKNSISLFNFYSIVFDFIYKYQLFDILNELEKESLIIFSDSPHILFKLLDFYTKMSNENKLKEISTLIRNLKIDNTYNPDLVIDWNRFMLF